VPKLKVPGTERLRLEVTRRVPEKQVFQLEAAE
jgi:hypothetical protein